MVINVKKAAVFLLLAILVAAGIFGMRKCTDYFYRQNYPRGYSQYVEAYASQYHLDKNMLYAVIKTESNFKPNATSNVGARGLTQIMEDTFYWIRSKLDDNTTQYDDMYLPEKNIQYGAYLLSSLHEEFGNYGTAIAAYHAGRTAAAQWLTDKRYSDDGKTLRNIPIEDTEHYVNKVLKCYQMYQKIYEKQ